ncbi:WD40-repeat-containing domain protein [Polychytrium aggregatum]|uniref:WD40-repeat-containing domain protein n=1 Tax=Polychytrium aggregatum TaxID=110093 RepID=UPI0022FEB7CC|nr:WD40-repeat-containing domain protein [Polychytrium aggregatum]KAI9199746.1 WD40-repeat-containing domain protein [Polychytrium aggregatum]
MLPSGTSAAERRREELEKKRQKLSQLREAREQRRPALLDLKRSESPNNLVGNTRREIDDLVASLVGERRAPIETSSVSSRSSTPVSIAPSTTPQPDAPQQQVSQQQPAAEVPERVQPNLVSAEFIIFDVAPKEKQLYNKEAQTVETWTQPEDHGFGDDEVDDDEYGAPAPEKVAQSTGTDAATDQLQPTISNEVEHIRDLTEEERRAIISSEQFMEFFDQSSKVIERALNEKYDYLIDYSITNEGEVHDDANKNVKQYCQFFDEKWSKNRWVTDLDWCPKYPELVLGSYGKNPNAINDPDGLVMIWNLHLRERPEYIFHAQSDVMTARFSEFHPNYVIGGTYSGQILLWDMRAKSQPVLKSPLSSTGHTHPVYSMAMVGTQNAHNLISASTDGIVCSWLLDMLAQPQEVLDLVLTGSKTEEVAVTTFGFPANETTTFWVGTEEGAVYQANRFDRAGSKAGISPLDSYRGHSGMITGLHFHPLFGASDFSDLFLTSSVDWTVKLWKVNKSTTKSATAPQTVAPLYSFNEADDYVYDVKWSPVHPALFAAVDGSGRISFYNLNQETEIPTTVVQATGNAGAAGSTAAAGAASAAQSTSTGVKALNKIAWDKEGKKTAVASSDGHIYIHDVGEMAIPHAEEWAVFERTLTELEANSASNPF